MTVRRKRSISLSPELDRRVECAARAEGVPVSVWIARSAEDRLLVIEGLAAMKEWAAENGEFTAAEMNAADAVVDSLLGVRKSA